jgi:UDP-glucose 4-epimerase
MKNKKIVIFGGSGSLGQTLIRRLHEDNELLIYSRDEAKHWTIKNQIQCPNTIFKVGDIRDKERVRQVIAQYNPEVIIMAAALKQVDTCELSPLESVQTNLLGINNILSAVEESAHCLKNLNSVMMVSTDKACAPANVYGMCKSISERIVTSYCKYSNLSHIKFINTRYGNVLDSRGSILPLFRHQITQDAHLTVTHPDMTRFLMTLDDSVDLIIHAHDNGDSGDTWIPKLKSMKIIDMANLFAQRYNKPIKITGIRPGEKMHESLVSRSESIRTHKKENHYVIKPSYSDTVHDNIFEYNSAQDVFSLEGLQHYLDGLNLLEKEIEDFPGKAIVENIRPFK